MKRFYTSNSGMNKGTLYQLRCLINRRNVSGRVKEEMNQIQDFLRSVMKVHVLCEFFGNKTQVLAANLSQMDFNFIIQWWKMEVLEWKAWHNSRSVCDALFVVRACTPQRVKREQRDRWSQRLRNGFADWHSYGRGAVKEGDGDRLVRFWRFMQLYCSATGHLKYAFECFNFVAQISSTLTAQEAYRTKWCWFANTKGTAAHNLSGDLLMEHWNKSMKTHLCGVGANQDCQSHFFTAAHLLSIWQHNCWHAPSHAASLKKVFWKRWANSSWLTDLLHGEKVFSSSRSHSHFPNFKINLFTKINQKTFVERVQKNIKRYSRTYDLKQKYVAESEIFEIAEAKIEGRHRACRKSFIDS